MNSEEEKSLESVNSSKEESDSELNKYNKKIVVISDDFQEAEVDIKEKELVDNLEVKKEPIVKNTSANIIKTKDLKVKPNSQVNSFENIFDILENALPVDGSLTNNVFPHPRNWLGPRFIAIWSIPIVIINQLRKLLISYNPVRPYQEMNFSINKTETIYTTINKAFNGNRPIRFLA